MKQNEKEWLKDIPPEAWMVAVAKRYGGPVSPSVYEKALKQKPEWFPQEVAARDKWSKVPQEVHDQYIVEVLQLDEEFRQCRKASGSDKYGLWYMINNPEEYKKWNEIYDNCKTELNIAAREKEIHDKHYGPYGINYRE